VLAPTAESTFGRGLKSGGRFCVGAFDRSVASIAVKIPRLIYCVKELIKFRTFSAIC
jgi:hypothetical protein